MAKLYIIFELITKFTEFNQCNFYVNRAVKSFI